MAEIPSQFVCFECIGDHYLADAVEAAACVAKCSYCDTVQEAMPLSELADRVEAVFRDHYERTAAEPNFYQQLMQRDREIEYEWYREGMSVADILPDLLGVSSAIAQNLRTVLNSRHEETGHDYSGEETAFDDEVHYEEIFPRHDSWSVEWDAFVNRLRNRARFFDPEALGFLTRLFSGLENRRTRQGFPVVVECGPGTHLERVWRGRVFQDHQALLNALERPDLQLGPPPASVAAAGRMNSRGISAFYGATEQEVALAEVRPPVGSHVAMAAFDITRPLRVLDLDALAQIQDTGSLFDPKYTAALRQSRFLRDLVNHFAAPIMPDEADLAYLPTQVVAEFLANGVQPRIDGILYRSVQAEAPGQNLVLFHHAAVVVPMNVPAGTEIEASYYSTSDDGDMEYAVRETLPKASPDLPKVAEIKSAHDWDIEWEPKIVPPVRVPALRIAEETVCVHEIRTVTVNSSCDMVRRHRGSEDEMDAF